MTNKESINSVQKEMMSLHYQRAVEAKKSGRPVVYATAMFPVEILKVFEPDIAVVYPENHAVMLIVNGLAEKMTDIAVTGSHLDKLGCSYELINTGYLLAKSDKNDQVEIKGIPELPLPDMLMACNNQCDVVAEWYQNLSQSLGNIPFKVINVGNRYDGFTDTLKISYVKKQLEDTIHFLEEKTGTPLDQDKLLELADQSNQATKLWRRYLEYGAQVPSPITVFDGFYHMAPIVSERGTTAAVEYYTQLLKETEDRVNARKFAVSTEKHRVLWDNLPTWFNFSKMKRYLAEKGVAVVGSTYLDVWKKELDTADFDSLLTSMAESYSEMYTNLTIEQRIALWKDKVEKFSVEGILFHYNRSCHTFSRLAGQIGTAMKKEFGDEFKSILFEGDMGLEERYQNHRFQTSIETYFS